MAIETMKQALQALRFALHVGFDESSESQIKKGDKAVRQHQDAITALHTAIAEAEKQEPVAWQGLHDQTDLYYRKPVQGDVRPLYTTPPAAPVQEPVALENVYETIIHWDEGGGKRSRRELARRIVALYTTPQPATQDNAFEGLAKAVREFATEQRAIEAKLKEKMQ